MIYVYELNCGKLNLCNLLKRHVTDYDNQKILSGTELKLRTEIVYGNHQF